jgi:hypothetical protein
MAIAIIVALERLGRCIFGKGWREKLDPKVKEWLDSLNSDVHSLLACCLIALYIGARIFVVVESFISIRRLPLGVFVTVDWADYIPHL